MQRPSLHVLSMQACAPCQPPPLTYPMLPACAQVKDGFGLPLEHSEAFFFTTELGPAAAGPALAAPGNFLVLEQDAAAAPLPWPAVTRNASRGVLSKAAWRVDARSFPQSVVTRVMPRSLKPEALYHKALGPPGGRFARFTHVF